VNVTAQVPSDLTLDMRIVDQLTTGQVPTMDFGELVRVGDEFRARTFFKVYLRINTVGQACELSQLGTPLARNSGTEIMPAGAYMATPAYEQAQNSNQQIPSGAKLGALGKVGGTLLLYSDPTGSSRTVTVTYTLSGDPITGATEVIPISQKSGSYSGTVQFTLTTL
jgi:hypothetical protein